MRVALYTRVSTTDQNCDLQLAELREYTTRRGWQIAEEYVDHWSGAKASRPALSELMEQAAQRKMDAVLVWKLDRFGRSLLSCLAGIQQLQSSGVRFIATTQNLDTDESNPASRFLLHILAAAAEFERELIRERSQAGSLRYKRDYQAGRVGKEVHSRSGRDLAPHRPLKVFNRERVVKLRARGLSLREIAKFLGVGRSTIARLLQGVPKALTGDSTGDD